MTDSHNRLGRTMMLLASLALLGTLWLGFDSLLTKRNNPNHNLKISPDAKELVLKRNRFGHYLARGTINGQAVTFLVDTGATQVSIPAHLSTALALPPEAHATVTTANGNIRVRTTRIDTLGLGPFQLQGIQAHLNPGLHDDEILLGMNVLKHFEFIQRQDTLLLRPHAP